MWHMIRHICYSAYHVQVIEHFRVLHSFPVCVLTCAPNITMPPKEEKDLEAKAVEQLVDSSIAKVSSQAKRLCQNDV